MTPFGDDAWRFAIPAGVDRAALLEALLSRRGTDFSDVVLTETVGLLARFAIPQSLSKALSHPETRELAAVVDASVAAARVAARTPREHAIDVVYDGEDLAAVCEQLGADAAQIHAEGDYEVAFLGFQPGFAYLRGGDPRLALPRRASPRAKVPARSVAIAAGYTGIYPFASPGGWHLLGRAPGFVPLAESGAALALGDRVRFVPREKVDELAPARPTTRHEGPTIEIEKLAGAALLVDDGRVGHMHEGVPHGGALDREALARANEAVGNPPGACAIELAGSIAIGGLEAKTDRATRVRYVAVEGGFAVPEVLGARGTLLAAGLGGHEGRWLRRGDRLPIARAGARLAVDPPSAPDAAAIEIVLAPDLPPAIEEIVLRTDFLVSNASDRTGTRLEGPDLPIDRAHLERPSAPMTRGAIEVTPRGLIVLGPDHPTTGGYPVVGVVAADALFARPLGARVRFERR